MKEIPIYKAEASVSGLAEAIRANSRIAYSAQLLPVQDKVEVDRFTAALSSEFMSAHADLKDDDLYFTKSILVSSNWNLNDDVFDKYETWAARHTPAHKPTNLGHDEHHIVGHMTDNWVIDNDGKIVADSTPIDDVPELFHIVNGAVIYTTWKDEALIERTEKLIAEIESGKKFVSMECLFSNFSYAVISPEGKFYTIARSETTAFLTKHLRAYGGKGVYNDHKIGRLPRNITFSAKGYVDNPGNPNSVILSTDKKFNFSLAMAKNPFFIQSGVSILEEDTHSTMETNMSDTIYKEQADKAEKRVATLEAAIEELRSQHTKAGFDKLTAQVEQLTKQVESLAAEKAELSSAKATAEKLATEAGVKLEELTKTRDELQAKVAKAEAEVVTSKRIAQLVEAGAKTEDAAAKVSKFVMLNDEQWAVVAESLVAQFPPMKDEEKDKEKKDKKDAKADDASQLDEEKDSAAAGATDESLEKAEVEKAAALSAKASNDKEDALAQTRKELGKAIAARLGRNDDEEESNK